MSRTLSAKGAALIADHEGKVNEPYNDPAGHATIGIGHLIHRGPVTDADRREWGTLTDQQVYDLFIADAGRFIDAVNHLVTVPLTQNQFDALVSFTFNLGEGALEESTLRQKLNRGDYAGAAQEFGKWVKADGKVLAGLVRRRKDEAALFLTLDDDQEAPVAGLDHLHPVFAQRVANACRARGTSVYSGARSTERQRQLYQDYLAGRGNPANPPGTSWHEYGEGMKGGPYALAVDFAEPYPHGEPGLIFPIEGEPWHAQPPEIPEPSRTAGADRRLPAAVPSPSKEDELFSPSPIASVHIVSAHSGRLLTSAGDTHGSVVTQERANGSLNQRWQLVGHDDGTVSLVNRAGDLALDRPDYATEAETRLQVARTEHNDAQRWKLDELADSLFRIWTPGTNRCIDIRMASKDDGAVAQLWYGQDGYRWQSFVFAPTV